MGRQEGMALSTPCEVEFWDGWQICSLCDREIFFLRAATIAEKLCVTGNEAKIFLCAATVTATLEVCAATTAATCNFFELSPFKAQQANRNAPGHKDEAQVNSFSKVIFFSRIMCRFVVSATGENDFVCRDHRHWQPRGKKVFVCSATAADIFKISLCTYLLCGYILQAPSPTWPL